MVGNKGPGSVVAAHPSRKGYSVYPVPILWGCAWVQVMQSPAEMVWLNGAPGSGKGVNTPYILESRGLSRSVTMCAVRSRSDTELRLYKCGGAVGYRVCNIEW